MEISAFSIEKCRIYLWLVPFQSRSQQVFAEQACRVTPDCEYIGLCNQKTEGCEKWNDRHPDSVQLYKSPLVPNADWESCKRVPLDPPSAAGVAFLLALVLGSA